MARNVFTKKELEEIERLKEEGRKSFYEKHRTTILFLLIILTIVSFVVLLWHGRSGP